MKFIAVNLFAFVYGLGLPSFIQCINFDRHLFGVTFNPYVKDDENGRMVPDSNYTFQNLKTMLVVITTKFTRILTAGPTLPNDTYVKNHTYYNTGDIMTRAAEAAALLNLERHNKSLTVIIEKNLIRWHTETRILSELQVVIEAAQISNSIYPGTVIGIQLNSYITYDMTTIESVSFWIKRLRDMTADLGIKNGLKVVYDDLNLTPPRGDNLLINTIWNFTNQIILNSDFIVYQYGPNFEKKNFNIGNEFARLSSKVTDFRNRVQKINKNAEVMWYTYSLEIHFRNFEQIRNYWAALNQYALEERIPVWVERAFDIPKYRNTSRGWWKLERNDLINNVSAYIENYSGKPVHILPTFNDNQTTVFQTTSTFSYGTNIFIAVVVIVLIGGFALFSITYFIFTRCRKSSRPKVLTKQEINEFEFGHHITTDSVEGEKSFDSEIPALRMPYDRSLEIPKARFEILWDERLGRGEFGLVYKAILKNEEGMDKDVAVKLPKQDFINVALKGLLSEIKILTYLGQHPNIVSICGSYTAELDKGVVYLAMELCPLGSLKTYLKKLKAGDKFGYDFSVSSPTLSSTGGQGNRVAPNILVQLIRWSNDIASGMEHLEKKNVLHADLATRNILLTTDKTAKVTDFGLSRRLYEYSNYKKRSQSPLPWRWLPIESLRNHDFSMKSDVWSYGVTLWEIFSFGNLPFPERSWNSEFMKDLENGLRLDQPTIAPDRMYLNHLFLRRNIYEIMKCCWKLVPDKRPNFAELQAQTKHILEKQMAKLQELDGRVYSDVIA